MRMRATPVPDLTRRFAQEVTPTAEAQDVEVRVHAETDAAVRCDPMRLLQALVNLASNALDKTPAGGSLTLRVARDGDEVRFRLTDTGAGFPPEVGARLFEPFWRGEDSRAKGAGLGLAITRGIVEQHGGRIDASSPPGEGATFTITLPVDT